MHTPLRARLLAASVALVATAASLTSASPAGAGVAAVQPDNRPTALSGVENGYVPAERLITVVPGCRVAREAGPSLALLYRMAAGANVALGARDCYRPLSGQVAASASATAAGNSACAATPSTYPDGRPKGTSMHGWGKAVDVSEPRGVTFTSPGYRFLKARAASVGWNHPGWAEPGGSSCPEQWHWEWVGDGGVLGGDPVRADVVALLPAGDGKGYAAVTGLGAVIPRGSARSFGAVDSLPLNSVIVGAAPTADRNGYWLLGGDGGIFNFGNAAFHGSTGNLRLNAPVIAMASTPDGGGYWLVAGDGGVFSFGNAAFYGSTGAMRLNSPVVGMAPAADGKGYWLVAADGGIFSFGSATFKGSTGNIRLAEPIVGMAASGTSGGYWLVASDGGVFAFGDAAFLGSAAGRGLASPVVALTRTPKADGYWITAADGSVVNLGAAGAFGAG
ncbi:MAG TPA: M15 family metallopeptidase [Acidimicrobiales bacterium]|nr:M15 family metallopeptidase [Acidimicrobiales bacterium]